MQVPPVTVVALNVGADVHQTDVLDATCAYTARLGVPCARSNEVSQRLPSNAAADVGTGAAPPPSLHDQLLSSISSIPGSFSFARLSVLCSTTNTAAFRWRRPRGRELGVLAAPRHPRHERHRRPPTNGHLPNRRHPQ